MKKTSPKPAVKRKGISSRDAFLAAYRITGSISIAARAAKIRRDMHYRWLKSDPDYSLAFAEAYKEACEALENECRIRAVRGVAEPVIYQGRLCYEPQIDPKTGQVKRDKDGRVVFSKEPLTVFKKSDVLLMFYMKRHMPEYRESFKMDHSGDVNLRFKGSLSDLLLAYREITKDPEDKD